MKKRISLFFLILLFCFSLAACGGVTAAAADREDGAEETAEDAVELVLSDRTGSVTVTSIQCRR